MEWVAQIVEKLKPQTDGGGIDGGDVDLAQVNEP